MFLHVPLRGTVIAIRELAAPALVGSNFTLVELGSCMSRIQCIQKFAQR